jgi:hypothetical protein
MERAECIPFWWETAAGDLIPDHWKLALVQPYLYRLAIKVTGCHSVTAAGWLAGVMEVIARCV